MDNVECVQIILLKPVCARLVRVRVWSCRVVAAPRCGGAGEASEATRMTIHSPCQRPTRVMLHTFMHHSDLPSCVLVPLLAAFDRVLVEAGSVGEGADTPPRAAADAVTLNRPRESSAERRRARAPSAHRTHVCPHMMTPSVRKQLSLSDLE